MRAPSVQPIVIAAGGTGGHFFPAEALAATLIARGHRIVLMTDARSGALKSTVFGGHEQHVLRGSGIAGRGAGRALQSVASLASGAVQARRILARLGAAVVVGFGGYPSIPPVLAARSLQRRPRIVLHEQNAVLGRANRFLAPFADRLALGFAGTALVPASVQICVTGNPVRQAIHALHGRKMADATALTHLLVLGGSLGARVFSDVVPDAVAALPSGQRAQLRVVQQCRAEDMARVQAAYAAAGVAAELAPFFADVADRLDAAQLVISRAGASTCAELAVAGRASILVPLPGAIDDHQTANARALLGATIMRQADFTAEALALRLRALLADPAALATSAQLAASCARPDAAAELADIVEALAVRQGAAR